MTIEVKICGLSTAGTLHAALDAGADHVGLVLFPPSPRNVDPAKASALANEARGRAGVVTLTVDADDALLDAIVTQVRPDALQFHGSESRARVADVARRYGIAIWKAIPVSDQNDVQAATAYAGVADRVLFDARPPKGATRPGGNAVAFDWRLLDRLDRTLPFVLSGGLDVGNVAEAVAVTRAPAVDVSSGVERAPGVKDEAKIRAFIDAARAAAGARHMADQ